MKYRHSYHAGNFADCFKHIVLLELLKHALRKPTPILFLETHAGQGGYELEGSEQGVAQEHGSGIDRLRSARDLPDSVRAYVDVISRLGSNPGRPAMLRMYPGSPMLAVAVLRAQDRAVFYELHPPAARELARRLGHRRNARVHCADGYAGLHAQLPPRERRGVVLIDPPYEDPQQEFVHALAALEEAHKRWPTGIYALWYPIKRRAAIQAFHARLRATSVRKILCAELGIYPDDSRVSLNGCGMVIVNPPFRLKDSLDEALPALHAALGARPGTRAGSFWLVPE